MYTGLSTDAEFVRSIDRARGSLAANLANIPRIESFDSLRHFRASTLEGANFQPIDLAIGDELFDSEDTVLMCGSTALSLWPDTKFALHGSKKMGWIGYQSRELQV
jgi:predicted rRNA methylase YqxC with S4 and FtsJ domains